MVTSMNEDREPPMSLYHEYCHENSDVKLHRPQPMVWCGMGSTPVFSKLPNGNRSGIGCTHHSAFQLVSTEKPTCDQTRPRPVVLKYKSEAEESTQVTWCSTGTNYRCSIAVTGVDRLWDLHPGNHWRTSLNDKSRGSKEDDEGEIDVGGDEAYASPSNNSPLSYGSRSDGGSTCMSPLNASTKCITPEKRLRTVISSPIRNTNDSIRGFSAVKVFAQSKDSFVEESSQISTRPICISERLGSLSPPNAIVHLPTTPAKLPEDEDLLKEKDIPLIMGSGNNVRERCLRSHISPTFKFSKHFPGEYVTAARLAEDEIFIREGGLVRTRPYIVTEHQLKTSTSSPVRSENNTRDFSMLATNFNDESYYGKEDDLNTFSYDPEESMLRSTVLWPFVNVKDRIQEHPTARTSGGDNFIDNGVDHPHTLGREKNEHDTKPNTILPAVIKTNSPRVASTPLKVETGTPLFITHSKLSGGRQDGQESLIIKFPDTGHEQDLCEKSSSPVLCSTMINNVQICGKQRFKERDSSTNKTSLEEYDIQIDDEQLSGGRGESLHKSSHLENHGTIEDKQSLVERRFLSHESFSTEKHNQIVDENIFENRSEYSQKSLSMVNPIQIGDQQLLEDGHGFPQNTYFAGSDRKIVDNQGSQEQNRYLRRSSPSKTHIKIGDEQRLENESIIERSSPQGNQTQISDQQSLQSRVASPQCKLAQIDAQQRLEDQDVPFQRSTVLVQSRDLRHRDGEAVVQQVGIASETKLVTGIQGSSLFSPEDTALRNRVLVLLWVLLGEGRLREVGYPIEPVHRILWRAVDVCCSVAGVKSAAAVPLNADHDCGSDMLCFRDHTHRFLEVCAPTREHWKQFGWASLTVDAVVRKIYDEELVPLLRLQVLPPDIQQAVEHLNQIDRKPLLQQNSSLEGDPSAGRLQTTAVVPAKKKRGRPAKISHKVDEGGRIERVMLWRFLLNLLEDPRNSPCIHWVQRDEGIFRILNTDWLARLWGRRHGNPRMTYEKMARAMRTYYRSKVLQPVPRLRNLPRKLVYKFNPAVIHKVAAMKLSCSTFSGRGLNYNTNSNK